MIRLRLFAFLLTLASASAWATDIDATLDWSQRSVLSTPASGVVREVAVKPGQRVEQGALLVRLDDRKAVAEVRRSQADVARLKLTLDEAEREYERALELYDRTVISERDRQLAEIDFSVAQANYAAATAAKTSAQVELEDTRLNAPFAGVIIAVAVTPGETVSNELSVTPMVTLASDRPLLARGRVDEATQRKLALDQAVVVRVGDERFQGQIDALGLEAVAGPDGNKFEIAVRFQPSEARQLRAGQQAVILLP